jgi:hypothetical protein
MKDLPLSQRPRGDERGVSSDRRPEFDELLGRARAEASALGNALDGDARRHLDELESLAATAAKKRTVSARTLTAAVLAYLSFARAAGIEPTLAPRTSGAVALVLAAKAPTPIRAVIGGHALRAVDAGWEFGRGPVLEAPAVELVEFLAGRSLVAPRRVQPPSA